MAKVSLGSKVVLSNGETVTYLGRYNAYRNGYPTDHSCSHEYSIVRKDPKPYYVFWDSTENEENLITRRDARLAEILEEGSMTPEKAEEKVFELMEDQYCQKSNFLITFLSMKTKGEDKLIFGLSPSTTTLRNMTKYSNVLAEGPDNNLHVICEQGYQTRKYRIHKYPSSKEELLKGVKYHRSYSEKTGWNYYNRPQETYLDEMDIDNYRVLDYFCEIETSLGNKTKIYPAFLR